MINGKIGVRDLSDCNITIGLRSKLISSHHPDAAADLRLRSQNIDEVYVHLH